MYLGPCRIKMADGNCISSRQVEGRSDRFRSGKPLAILRCQPVWGNQGGRHENSFPRNDVGQSDGQNRRQNNYNSHHLDLFQATEIGRPFELFFVPFCNFPILIGEINHLKHPKTK